MFEIQILIPVVGNDGVTFEPAHHAVFEALVIARFGGVTLFPSTAVGSWVDAGTTYHDVTRVYGIAVRSITQGDLIAEIAAFAKQHYQQVNVYLRYLGIAEIL